MIYVWPHLALAQNYSDLGFAIKHYNHLFNQSYSINSFTARAITGCELIQYPLHFVIEDKTSLTRKNIYMT